MTSNEPYELFSPAEAVNRLASSGFSRGDAQRMVDQYLADNTAQFGEPAGGWMVDRYDIAEIIDRETAQRDAGREIRRGTVGITGGITGGEALTDATDATDATDVDDTGTDVDGEGDVPRGEASVVGLECPECGEDAVEQPPDTLVPYEAHGMAVPRYAHADGEPLCPVMGPHGYEPAQPREVVEDAASERDADPLQSARDAVSAAMSDPISEPGEDSRGVGDAHTDQVDEMSDEAGEERS